MSRTATEGHFITFDEFFEIVRTIIPSLPVEGAPPGFEWYPEDRWEIAVQSADIYRCLRPTEEREGLHYLIAITTREIEEFVEGDNVAGLIDHAAMKQISACLSIVRSMVERTCVMPR